MTTLQKLDDAVRRSMEAAANQAISQLASERIYGFLLTHYVFQSCRAAVLTEAQRERSKHKEQKWTLPTAGTASTGTTFSQSPIGSSHRSKAADRKRRSHASSSVRAMLHVRQNVIIDPQIVLSVLDYTEGPGVPFFAYAELFNDAETLARLRAELYLGARWDYLDLERSRVPKV